MQNLFFSSNLLTRISLAHSRPEHNKITGSLTFQSICKLGQHCIVYSHKTKHACIQTRTFLSLIEVINPGPRTRARFPPFLSVQGAPPPGGQEESVTCGSVAWCLVDGPQSPALSADNGNPTYQEIPIKVQGGEAKLEICQFYEKSWNFDILISQWMGYHFYISMKCLRCRGLGIRLATWDNTWQTAN